MDYAKVDAALAAALSHPSPVQPDHFRVSLRTHQPLEPAEQAELQSIGVQGVVAGRSVFSGDLSLKDVAALTSKPYVRLISLAQQLRPLTQPK